MIGASEACAPEPQAELAGRIFGSVRIVIQMKLELGNVYKTRSGRDAYVDEYLPEKIYAYRGQVSINNILHIFTWKSDGTFIGKLHESDYDLVTLAEKI